MPGCAWRGAVTCQQPGPDRLHWHGHFLTRTLDADIDAGLRESDLVTGGGFDRGDRAPGQLQNAMRITWTAYQSVSKRVSVDAVIDSGTFAARPAGASRFTACCIRSGRLMVKTIASGLAFRPAYSRCRDRWRSTPITAKMPSGTDVAAATLTRIPGELGPAGALVWGALGERHPALKVWWARPHRGDNGDIVEAEVDAGRAADYQAAFEEGVASGEAALWAHAATPIEETRCASRANDDRATNPAP